MTEYIINHWKKTCTYSASQDTIRLATENTNILTDDELSEYISDCLTHEYTHKILSDLFNRDASSLFDAVEFLFRNDALHEKTLLHRITYQTYIRKYGFDRFLKRKEITKHDVLGAKILCSIRGVK